MKIKINISVFFIFFDSFMTNFYQVIKKFHLAIITIICSLMHNDVLLAEQESRWEIGIGSVAAQTPQYFGSNHYYRGILPYPV